MLELIKKFRKDEDGASLIEYTLLIGLISVALVLLIGQVSGQLQVLWAAVLSALTPAA